jgi:hypothetical protein
MLVLKNWVLPYFNPPNRRNTIQSYPQTFMDSFFPGMTSENLWPDFAHYHRKRMH